MTQLNKHSKITDCLTPIYIPYRGVSESFCDPVSLYVTVSLNGHNVGGNLTL